MDTLDTQSDYRRCTVCKQVVPLYPVGMQCTCELAQANHRLAIHTARQLAGAPPASCLYRSSDEQGLPESDTHVRRVWPRSYGWPRTALICAICLALAALFCHMTDGASRAGHDQARLWEATDASPVTFGGQP
jgi:hypothetical protein